MVEGHIFTTAKNCANQQAFITHIVYSIMCFSLWVDRHHTLWIRSLSNQENQITIDCQMFVDPFQIIWEPQPIPSGQVCLSHAHTLTHTTKPAVVTTINWSPILKFKTTSNEKEPKQYSEL